MEVTKLAYALGAEIAGIDLRRPVDAAAIAHIRSAWLEHHVLVFRDQDITPQQHVAFSRCFGELERHANRYNRHPDYPELFLVTNRTIDGKPSDTRNVGRQWHSDGAYSLRPPTGSLLHSQELPGVGGDTLFANMNLAYQSLSPKLRQLLDGLWAVNDRAAVKNNANIDPQRMAERLKVNPPVAHPVVRVHPETGRKSLYVSETVTTQFVGMKPEESRPLLEFLFAHSVRAEFVYRHRWRVHDLVMWDNRCTMHLAPPDYDTSKPRHMQRTTLLGAESGHLYTG